MTVARMLIGHFTKSSNCDVAGSLHHKLSIGPKMELKVEFTNCKSGSSVGLIAISENVKGNAK